MTFNYTTLSRKDVHISLLFRILYLLLLTLPTLCCSAPSFGAEQKMPVAITVTVVVTIIQVVLLFFISKAALRLQCHYMPRAKGCVKILSCLACIYLPILELIFLITEEEEILVPALRQPGIADMNSLTTSFFVFMEGIPSISPSKLAFFLKGHGYYAIADDCGQSLKVFTDRGTFTCIINSANLYMFKEIEDYEHYNIPRNSRWAIEQSHDYSSVAIVYDIDFNPFKQDELDLTNIITSALKEIE